MYLACWDPEQRPEVAVSGITRARQKGRRYQIHVHDVVLPDLIDSCLQQVGVCDLPTVKDSGGIVVLLLYMAGMQTALHYE